MSKQSTVSLKSLELSGFKSFNKRIKLDFQEGVTAIVGPNGSGKSNLADAIRWVFAEARSTKLRVKDSEDLIFQGTHKKARASMAEVSIVLTNTHSISGTAEIEIRRELLRSGESQYSLNRKKTRKQDVEQLLARCGFGTQSYTIVGQGTIEALVTSGGVERKLLFEEASGIRQYELSRIAALKKLLSSESNLLQTESLLAELLPGQELLAKNAALAQKKSTIEQELLTKRTEYIASESYVYKQEKLRLEQELAQAQKDLIVAKTQYSTLVEESMRAQKDSLTKAQAAQRTLAVLTKQKDSIKDTLHTQTTQKELLNATTARERFDVAALKTKTKQLSNITTQLKESTDSHTKIEKTVASFEQKILLLNAKLMGYTHELDAVKLSLSRSQKQEFVAHSKGLITLMRTQLRQGVRRQEMDLTLQKIFQMLVLAGEDDTAALALSIGKLQHKISGIMSEREELVEQQNKEIIQQRSRELDIASLEASMARLAEELRALNELQEKQIATIAEIRELELSIVKKQKSLLNIETSIAKELEAISTLQKTSTSSSRSTALLAELEKNTRLSAQLQARIEQIQLQLQTVLGNFSASLQKAKEWNIRHLSVGAKHHPPANINAILQLEAQLVAVSEIDPSIIEKAQVQTERIEFLQSQKADLDSAIVDARRLLEKLEAQIAKIFEANFAAINTHFQKFFVELFGGGVAHLHLSREESGEYGIEIVAVPPGKKNTSINQLSGGEKSLSSLALLAAIIATNPSPFVLLDEVDAALDDENSTKFCSILTSLARRSQILVITHNHETMQVAHQLIGITAAGGDTEVLTLSLEAADELVNT